MPAGWGGPLDPDLDIVIAQALGIAPEMVTDDLAYQDTPGWDSLRHLGLILRLEDAYGLEFDDGTAASLTSVAAIRRFLTSAGSTSAKRETDQAADAADGSRRPTRLGRTAVTKIDGNVPEIRYRGYSVTDLAQNSTFEEAAHCLLYGELPSPSQTADFAAWLTSERALEQDLIDVIAAFRNESAVNSIIAVLATDSGWKGYSTFEELAIALIAKLPTVVATHAALAAGRPIPNPNPDLGHTANLLFMMRGETPRSVEEKALDRTLVLQMDHGLAPSAASSRAAVGVGTDVRHAVLAGVSVFSGDLHAGAVGKAMEVQARITDADSARTTAGRWRDGEGRPYGFGHRVHKGQDPRSGMMRDVATTLSDALGMHRPLRQVDLLVDAVDEEWRGTLRPNYDGYGAAVYRLLGIDSTIATAVFTCSRIVGLLSHVAEQLSENFVMPPPPEYTGPADRAVVGDDSTE